ncbi:MAG: phosphomannomutase [Polyangia bacterium]|jgi:phosphomannomutase/phosphomannomutase/phosphoglucomutase|nr:phosphomannomutase [Polyangia bacterium]
MSTPRLLSCFKAYDIRGRVPDELDEELAYKLGRAFAAQQGAKSVVVGRDVRSSSAQLSSALSRGLADAGVRVLDVGLVGTEVVYFATSYLEADGGIMVTASHNPADYNGMKLVGRRSVPLSGDAGLPELERRCAWGELGPRAGGGFREERDVTEAYLDHLMGYVDLARLTPMKVVSDPGNGCAGPFVERLAGRLPLDLVKVLHEPDGTFPNGVPNPMLEENRARTARAVRESGAALGMAWDGDFDRCFFFDEGGNFVEGYYLVGLLAEALLGQHPGAAVIYDTRLVWNTVEMVEAAGGRPVLSKCGHAFIKARMRAEDALYGGEMSAHHYFRDFFYCDSGMIPWLLVLGRLSETGRPLSELLGSRMARFPCSGEINRRIEDPDAVLDAVRRRYASRAESVDETDGISMSMGNWRFNLRRSNTEPLVRLNVESRLDVELMWEKTTELLALLE